MDSDRANSQARRLLQGVLYSLAAGAAFFLWWRLAQAPLHEDEAAYAAWALDIARGDWFAWQVPLDKPPLALYPLALIIAKGARAEWLIRLPNLLWGLLGLWATGAVAASAGRHAILARWFLLASPLWWAMWASAFTDMAGVALSMAALAIAWQTPVVEKSLSRTSGNAQRAEAKGRRRQGALSGLLMGLAILAKPTMAFLLPLFAVSPVRASSDPEQTPALDGAIRPSSSLASEPRAGGWVEAFTALLLLAWAWDASRAAPSWWRLGVDAYGSLGRIAWSGPAWAWLALGAFGLPLGGWFLRRQFTSRATPFSRTLTTAQGARPPLSRFAVITPRLPLSARVVIRWAVVLWIPLHILMGFQPWERYLLPMLPLVALCLAPRPDTALQRTRSALLSPLSILIIAAPLLAGPFHFAPQDGRWHGIQGIGSAVSALPPGAELWYGHLGRPLSWYAAGSAASLRWAGEAWERFPGCEPGRYVGTHQQESLPAAMEQVLQSGDFALWRCPG